MASKKFFKKDCFFQIPYLFLLRYFIIFTSHDKSIKIKVSPALTLQPPIVKYTARRCTRTRCKRVSRWYSFVTQFTLYEIPRLERLLVGHPTLSLIHTIFLLRIKRYAQSAKDLFCFQHFCDNNKDCRSCIKYARHKTVTLLNFCDFFVSENNIVLKKKILTLNCEHKAIS